MSTSPASTPAAFCRIFLSSMWCRFTPTLLRKFSSGTLVAFRGFPSSSADARWLAALPDAEYPPARLRRIVRGVGVLPDRSRPESLTHLHAADPHARRGYHPFAPPPHSSR